MRGGSWRDISGAGVSAFSVQCRRSHSVYEPGVRAALLSMLD